MHDIDIMKECFSGFAKLSCSLKDMAKTAEERVEVSEELRNASEA